MSSSDDNRDSSGRGSVDNQEGMASYQTDPGVGDDYFRPAVKRDEPSQRRSSAGGGSFGQLFKLALAISLLLLVVGLGFYLYFWWQLPPIHKATDYRPALATQIFSADLELIGEFHKQYRHLTPLDEIPPMVRKAFIAAEDSRFFEHRGIDYLGILRALIKNIQAGGVKQGGSTITQQVSRSLLLTPERTLARKIKEAMLAFRIEKQLTKEEILYLYLNQIYLGHGAYGVAAAARVYFNKDLNQLTLAEVSLLAGMPRAPSRDNPFVNRERARDKRSYVLRKMAEIGFITPEEQAQADAEPFVLDDRSKEINQSVAPYFAEHVRRYLASKYGEEMLYAGGLRVYTTLSLAMQRFAQEALRWNLHELDRRHGFRGPLRQLEKAEIDAYQARSEAQQELESQYYNFPQPPFPVGEEAYKAEKLTAVVTEVDDKKMRVKVYTDKDHGWIPFVLMQWARKPNADLAPEHDLIRRPSQALKVGDSILVRRAEVSELVAAVPKAEKERQQEEYADQTLFALVQEPTVEGSIMAVDPSNGFVRAMVGGYDYARSEFNRVVQARRQPGSSFKPILYAAALDKGYSPATLILDAPVVYDDPLSDTIWRPKNYTGTFKGDILFRTALVESLNVVSVKILQDVGLDYAMDYARKLGVVSPLTRDSTLALGSSVLTPAELTAAYMVFASGGVRRPQVFIKKILDRDGNLLERHTYDDPAVDLLTQLQEMQGELEASEIESLQDEEEVETAGDGLPLVSRAEAEEFSEFDLEASLAPDKYRIRQPGQVIREETAYIMTHLLSEVIAYGTGWRARALGRPSAGKTGTTNENIDAWFVGFTPDLVATAWVGFDEKKSLGKLETGSRAAAPMWLKFMQAALKDKPMKAFRVPGGVTFAKIDPKSGKLADDNTEKPVLEAFVAGSEPRESAEATATGAKDFFLEE